MKVLSLGGSLINPGEIDVSFLKKFRKLILQSKDKFIIVCGGGALAREYMSASKEVCPYVPDVDWFGIEATWMNANLVWRLFHMMPREVFKEPVKCSFQKVLIASGWKPGFTSDGDAVLWAVRNNVDTVFNLTNTDYVYDKDPNKYKSAKPIKQISWKDYLKHVGKYKPGMHVPFDPVASKLAMRHDIKVIIINGRKLNNLARAFAGKPFIGTVIA